MDNLTEKLIQEIQALPEHLQEQVFNFILFLKWKHEREQTTETAKNPAFGCGTVKGLLAPDFEEPLEEFKDYMQ